MSEWKFLTDDDAVLVTNHPYWFIGVRYGEIDIRRGFIALDGNFYTDEYGDKEIREEAINISRTYFLPVGFMDNPEGKSSYFAPKPDDELKEKVIYLSKEVERRNKEKEMESLPSLLTKMHSGIYIKDDLEKKSLFAKLRDMIFN